MNPGLTADAWDGLGGVTAEPESEQSEEVRNGGGEVTGSGGEVIDRKPGGGIKTWKYNDLCFLIGNYWAKVVVIRDKCHFSASTFCWQLKVANTHDLLSVIT